MCCAAILICAGARDAGDQGAGENGDLSDCGERGGDLLGSAYQDCLQEAQASVRYCCCCCCWWACHISGMSTAGPNCPILYKIQAASANKAVPYLDSGYCNAAKGSQSELELHVLLLDCQGLRPDSCSRP